MESQDSIPVLKVENLAVAYKVRKGEIQAVNNVSFEIQQREIYGIVGESGCGKSTVAWSLIISLGTNGHIKHGSIQFQGQEMVGKSDEALRRIRGNRIALVPQDPTQSLNPCLRIGTQIKEVLKVHSGMNDSDAEEKCLWMLNRVYMPDAANVMQRYPHQLSGGQQQRVIIAMALLNNPALLIMDEPTTALDVTVEAAVLDLIMELQNEFNTAILYITHNLGVIARVASRVAVMYAGEIVEQASVKDLFSEPKHPYTQGLLRSVPKLGTDKASSTLFPIKGTVPPLNQRPSGCFFGPRCHYARQECLNEHPRFRLIPGTRTMARCHLSEAIDPFDFKPDKEPNLKVGVSGETDNRPMLSVERLKKYYPVQPNTLKEVLRPSQRRSVKAIENVTFRIQKGKTLAIVGESGCGKSTLLKTIIGLEEVTGGKVELWGFDISNHISRRDEQLIRQLQMVFQDPDSTMNPSHTVGQQIGRPMQRFRTVPNNKIREEVVKLLEAVRLNENYYDRFPHQLSGGEKQRAGIARALASRPELLLCDEPVSALDVSVQASILNLLIEVQNKSEITLIFISHDLSVVRYISDYVCVMYLGQIMELGPVEAVYSPPHHPYTEALLSAVPIPDPFAEQKNIRLEGVIPSAINPPQGCRFNTRCPRRNVLSYPEICESEPHSQEDGSGRYIFCHIPIEQLRQIQNICRPSK